MSLPQIDFTPHFAQPGALPFKGRHATMPWSSTVPVPTEDLDTVWKSLVAQPLPPRKRLVYLHIPFCATHCVFCGFYQNRYDRDACEGYSNYLIREIEMEAGSSLHQSVPVHAIYFGGGTPSALSATSLRRILETLRQQLPLAPDCEITIEGRILNFDDERIDACLDAGVNRFSIGIQSFNSQIRKKMARTSDRTQAVRFLENLCRRDQATVVCDLLFGLPGQNAANWAEDLSQAKEIGLDGIDLYALNLFPNTPLGKAVQGNLITIPNFAECRDLYLQGCEYFTNVGWEQISNSHWARTPRERNLYNLSIKQGADCFAFGSGSGGALNGYSWMEERTLEKYYAAIDQHRKPFMMLMRPREQNFQWRQMLQAGIETGHVVLEEITPHADAMFPLLSQWHQAGLLHDASTCLRMTNVGRFWASNLLQSLLQIVTQLSAPEGATLRQERGHGAYVNFG
jgi:putative heme utilization radical SAM enzyme HutW